jgi:hypothetical protein
MIPPAAVLAAGGAGFGSVVSAIETRYHAHATRIPFLGLASFVAHRSTQGGVSGVHLAEFDHFPVDADGDEMNRIVEEKLGHGWERIIRETRQKRRMQTSIFARPDGNRMDLFVVDLDHGELDIVQVTVNADHLNQYLAQHGHGDVTD